MEWLSSSESTEVLARVLYQIQAVIKLQQKYRIYEIRKIQYDTYTV